MSGESGYSMLNQIVQNSGYGNGAMHTPMGTPIVYGKTYLPQSGLSSNPPLSSSVVDRVNQELNMQSPGGGNSVGDSGGAGGAGVGAGAAGGGNAAGSAGNSGDGGTGDSSSATGGAPGGDGGGGGGGGK